LISVGFTFDPRDVRVSIPAIPAPPGRDPSPAPSRKSALEGWGPRSPDDRRPPPPPPAVRRRDPLSESRHPQKRPTPPALPATNRQPNPEVLDPTNRKSPRPRMIQIRRKCPRDIRRLRPRPSRREPSRAGAVHSRIRPQQDPSTVPEGPADPLGGVEDVGASKRSEAALLPQGRQHSRRGPPLSGRGERRGRRGRTGSPEGCGGGGCGPRLRKER